MYGTSSRPGFGLYNINYCPLPELIIGDVSVNEGEDPVATVPVVSRIQ